MKTQDVNAPVPRFTLTKVEAAASLGMTLRTFERQVYPELNETVCRGKTVWIPIDEIDGWVQRNRRRRI